MSRFESTLTPPASWVKTFPSIVIVVAAPLGLVLGEAEGLDDGDGDDDGEELVDADGLLDGEALTDAEGLLEGDDDGLGELDGEVDGDALGVAEGLLEGVPETDVLGLVLGLVLGDVEGEAETDVLGLEETDALGDEDGDEDGDVEGDDDPVVSAQLANAPAFRVPPEGVKVTFRLVCALANVSLAELVVIAASVTSSVFSVSPDQVVVPLLLRPQQAIANPPAETSIVPVKSMSSAVESVSVGVALTRDVALYA